MKKIFLIGVFLIISIIFFYSLPIYAGKETGTGNAKQLEAKQKQEEQKKKEQREKEQIEASKDLDIGNVVRGAQDFLDEGEEMVADEAMQVFSSSLVNLFMAAGTVIAVIVISILGIKYMMGSVEEKAEIKETLIPFIAGCVVIFGAFTIWKIAIIIGSDF